MQRNRPPSEQTTTVLLALAEDPTAWRHGYELCQQTELKAGSMYPILIRLADRGLLETTWETEIPVGRPPRQAASRRRSANRRRNLQTATADAQICPHWLQDVAQPTAPRDSPFPPVPVGA
ncbi:MAG: PadR family transcriptional regulator [Acidobacteria bacterium]|nr:PadR family transcriptional regulator [Acidobacteriota bacterium]